METGLTIKETQEMIKAMEHVQSTIDNISSGEQAAEAKIRSAKAIIGLKASLKEMQDEQANEGSLVIPGVPQELSDHIASFLEPSDFQGDTLIVDSDGSFKASDNN